MCQLFARVFAFVVQFQYDSTIAVRFNFPRGNYENAELQVTEEFVRKRWEIELRAKKARFCFQNRECGKRDFSWLCGYFEGAIRLRRFHRKSSKSD